ncbi:hypothetical protein IP84_04740 [beta proteobacterium AAP99]|nr:hypothetical protein IP84_04740 [beta proteobacterium AAP99]
MTPFALSILGASLSAGHLSGDEVLRQIAARGGAMADFSVMAPTQQASAQLAAEDAAAASALAECVRGCAANAWLPCAGVGMTAQSAHQRLVDLLGRAGLDHMRALPHELPTGAETASDPMALVFAQFEADPSLSAVLLHARRLVKAGPGHEVHVDVFLLVGSTDRLQRRVSEAGTPPQTDPSSDWRVLIGAGLEKIAPMGRAYRPVAVSLQCDERGSPVVESTTAARRLDSTQTAAAFVQGWTHLTQATGDVTQWPARKPFWVVDRRVSQDSIALQGVAMAVAHPGAKDFFLPRSDLMHSHEALHLADEHADSSGASALLAWTLACMQLARQAPSKQNSAVVLGLKNPNRIDLGIVTRTAVQLG